MGALETQSLRSRFDQFIRRSSVFFFFILKAKLDSIDIALNAVAL